MTPKEALAKITELAPETQVLYSNWTGKFYVSNYLEDGSDYGVLKGMGEHRATANEAVIAYWQALTRCKRIVKDAFKSTREELVYNPISGEFQPFAAEMVATHLVTDGDDSNKG